MSEVGGQKKRDGYLLLVNCYLFEWNEKVDCGLGNAEVIEFGSRNGERRRLSAKSIESRGSRCQVSAQPPAKKNGRSNRKRN